MTQSSTAKAAALIWAQIFVCLSLCAQYPRKDAIMGIHYAFKSDEAGDANAVVWIPGANMYVTAMSGGGEMPMEGFSALGKFLWTETAGFDARGLWYNPKRKRVESNSSGNDGWYFQQFDENGDLVSTPTKFLTGNHQPDPESNLSFTGKAVVGLNNDDIYYYHPTNGKFLKSFSLDKPKDADFETRGTGQSELIDRFKGKAWDFNSNALMATGVAAFPLATLEIRHGAIVFYNLEGGFLFYTKLPDSVSLPKKLFIPRDLDPEEFAEDGEQEVVEVEEEEELVSDYQKIKLELPEKNHFSFANQMAWIFEPKTRTWMAFKVFN